MHEREEEQKRGRIENCLNYMADLVWVIATGQRIKKDVIKPYTELINREKQKKSLQAHKDDDFYAILKERVESRKKKGGDSA